MIGNQSAQSAALHIMQMTITMLRKKVKNKSKTGHTANCAKHQCWNPDPEHLKKNVAGSGIDHFRIHNTAKHGHVF